MADGPRFLPARAEQQPLRLMLQDCNKNAIFRNILFFADEWESAEDWKAPTDLPVRLSLCCHGRLEGCSLGISKNKHFCASTVECHP